jgi:hypothetical protein
MNHEASPMSAINIGGSHKGARINTQGIGSGKNLPNARMPHQNNRKTNKKPIPGNTDLFFIFLSFQLNICKKNRKHEDPYKKMSVVLDRLR